MHVTLDRAETDWHGKFQQRIQQFDEVTTAYVVSGPCNYVLHVRARSLNDFSRFIVEKLNKVAGVRDICSYIVMQKIKDACGQLPLE